jgi:hypothetical protein
VLTSVDRRLVRKAFAAALVLVACVVVAPAAKAVDPPPGCHLESVEDSLGHRTHQVVCPGDAGGSSGGSSGPVGPSCVLSGLGQYCIGVSACWSNVPSAIPVELWPVDSRPSVDAIYTYQSCDPDPSGTLTGWSWYTPPQMSAAQAAREAFGLLATPGFTVGFNPPGRAVVGTAVGLVDTLGEWFSGRVCGRVVDHLVLGRGELAEGASVPVAEIQALVTLGGS